ncbi:MAG: hypothetical protein AB1505_17395 [Candidatus Latescibacterota bacterium]
MAWIHASGMPIGYLREGGFLFAEGLPSGAAGSDTADRPEQDFFGRAVIATVCRGLEGDGRLIEVPLGHPIYHSFYDDDSGFPGEDKSHGLPVPPPTWHYRKGFKDRPGLWGVEPDGELVAAISDLGLHGGWGLGTDDNDAA